MSCTCDKNEGPKQKGKTALVDALRTLISFVDGSKLWVYNITYLRKWAEKKKILGFTYELSEDPKTHARRHLPLMVIFNAIFMPVLVLKQQTKV